jgi:hypothetical protein
MCPVRNVTYVSGRSHPVLAVRTEQSLIRAIDCLNRGARGLRPFPERRLGGPLHSIAGTWLLDPPRPIELLWWRLKARKA